MLPVQLRMGAPESRLSQTVPEVRLTLLGQAPQGCVMRAAWWWIDRWRQSTAFTDMTAEEQGLYRNLLDEVWLREDCIIPDDPRILARVSGDPEAWARCGEKVLAWMKPVPGGYTHQTALEVIGQSVRRAANQKRYRDKHNNAPDNAGDNGSNNKPDSPSPSPSPSMSQVGRKNGKPADLPADIQGERLLRDSRVAKERRFYEMIRRLSELQPQKDPSDIAREVTTYQAKDGRQVRGVVRPEGLTDERLDRSLEDAQWWIDDLTKPKEVAGGTA